MKLSYIVKDKYQNINEILSNEFHISTRLASKLIRNSLISKNGTVVDTRNSVAFGDLIEVDLGFEEDNSNIVPTKMNLDIVYEDEWFIVINKPAGIAIHPSQLHYSDSLSNGIRFYFDSINLKKKIRSVNRLDFDTSGLVIFAKCEYIHEAFNRQMQNGSFKKEYLCIVQGILENKTGTISLPIARKPGSIIEREINENGQNAITHYEVVKEFNNYSLVLCKLETGRTHQIRLHIKSISHPIIGDSLYGVKSDLINRQALHSYKIQCIHPVSKEILEFKSDLPKEFIKLIDAKKD